MKTINHTLLALTACLLTGTLQAQPYEPGQMGALPALLSVEQVRKDLSLSASQSAQVDALRKEYRDAARKIVSEAALNPSQRTNAKAKLDQLNRSTNQRALQLLSKKQKAQLAGHEHRYIGESLLLLPAVQSVLGLDSGQSEKIAALKKEADDKVADINARFDKGEIGPHERRAMLRKDRQDRNKRLSAILNPGQREAFQTLHL